MNDSILQKILSNGLAEIHCNLSEEAQSQLLTYVGELRKWNKAYNLTAIKDPEQIIRLHLLDSLAIIPYIHGASVLDVGSGAGLPGIPLAIALPKITFTLLDSNGKKTRFLQHVVATLGLSNVNVVQSRAEAFAPQADFATIVVRAVGKVNDILSLTKHLCAKDGEWVLMKGAHVDDELASADVKASVHQYTIPGVSMRKLLVINKEDL